MDIFNRNKKRRVAPNCKTCGALLLRIVYGYPMDSTMRDAERGQIVLGGCIVNGNDPEWACPNDCTDAVLVESKSTIRSVDELSASAKSWLDIYCSRSNGYAWPSYDIDRNPELLTPTDLLSPAFLSYPIQRKYLEPMLKVDSEPGPYERLFHAMRLVVVDSEFGEDRFEDVLVDHIWRADDSAWGRLVTAIEATKFKIEKRKSGLTSVAVSKILHRKRPHLVPLIDKRIRKFYSAERLTDRDLLVRIHSDFCANIKMLETWCDGRYLPDGRKMTPLRALDIVVWMEGEKATHS